MIRISRAAGTLLTTAALALTLAPAAGATTISGAQHDLTMSTILPASHGNGGSGSGGGHGSGGSGGSGGGGHHGGGNQYNSYAAVCDGDCRHESRRPRPIDPQTTRTGCGDPYNYDAGYYGCYQPQD